MNHKLSQLLRIILISVFVLASCGPVTPVPTVIEISKTPPSIEVQKEQVGPYVVGQTPPIGQRLELMPAIEFTFDRDMDQTKTSGAFTLLDLNKQPVPGKKAWLTASASLVVKLTRISSCTGLPSRATAEVEKIAV